MRARTFCARRQRHGGVAFAPSRFKRRETTFHGGVASAKGTPTATRLDGLFAPQAQRKPDSPLRELARLRWRESEGPGVCRVQGESLDLRIPAIGVGPTRGGGNWTGEPTAELQSPSNPVFRLP